MLDLRAPYSSWSNSGVCIHNMLTTANKNIILKHMDSNKKLETAQLTTHKIFLQNISLQLLTKNDVIILFQLTYDEVSHLMGLWRWRAPVSLPC